MDWGKTPVRAADTPGFIVNRVNRPFTLEALALLEAGTGSVASIDLAIRSAGFPMGPFELMDLVGIDVNLAAARAIFAAMSYEPRFRPSAIQERLVEAGRFGRKSGEGFYWYGEDGRPIGVAGAFAAIDEPHGTPELRPPALPSGGSTAATALSDDVVERVVLAIVDEAYRALGDRVAEPVGHRPRAAARGRPSARAVRVGGRAWWRRSRPAAARALAIGGPAVRARACPRGGGRDGTLSSAPPSAFRRAVASCTPTRQSPPCRRNLETP